MDIDVAYLGSENWDAHMTERLRWLRENEPGALVGEGRSLPRHQVRRRGLRLEAPGAVHVGSSASARRNPAKIGLIDEAEPRHTPAAQSHQPRLHAAHGAQARDRVPRDRHRIDRRRRGARRVRFRQGDRRPAAAQADRRDDRHPPRGLRPLPPLVRHHDRGRRHERSGGARSAPGSPSSSTRPTCARSSRTAACSRATTW